ncbi:polyketide synthase [Hydrococcus rivularis NIES-593]|uniref:Phenolphthiocerol/phthiocerol polyketide synthase subunit E n=1 Tax=Hydrococcus rivularis NIES-593 TaxID=1921803 RepID=A0A1U7HBC9_9CYAN|nr:type I polyketide synthase [Hydrococcus rivularis]OKH20886.1 polyketide synthase [Hydrococcus rivularis NIES-593]
MNTNGSEIAIVGLAGRFPGAKNLEEFWQNLQNGVESVSFFSDEELLAEGIDKSVLSDRNYVKARAVLEDAELFDAAFFGFSPKEAEITDPQHRLFLECAWEALENAGYNSETDSGSIGVYAGSSLSGYLLNAYLNPNIVNSVDFHQLAIAGDKDYLATRVSYKLNLTGASYTIQTACSTSLVAVHLACQSLLNGECDLALAGGVSISASRKTGYFYKEGGIHSRDGHCRAFDAKAGGIVGGEGVGIVVLKRLEDAIANRDTIHAVIKGSATSNDGSLKVSYTAPRIEGQAKAIATAQLIAEVEPETITYIEAHGTGTALGDPIEIAALREVFQGGTQKKGFCAIGSLKTNIGHLDAAAGVAGLIKTVLALKHKQIPPSLHFEQPNPQIDFANSPFFVNTQLSEWKTNGTPRRAGVSSFGIGGTNAHVILEEFHAEAQRRRGQREEGGTRGQGDKGTRRQGELIQNLTWQLLVLSAKTESALETATDNLARHLDKHSELNLADVAYTLQVGRKAFNYRRMLVCRNLEDAAQALKSRDPKNILTQSCQSSHRPVVFMFPGQGSQYVNMGRELYQNEPVFTYWFDRCAELLKPHLNLDIRQIVYPDEIDTQQQLNQTFITQPALFAIAYALSQLWMSWGVRPEAAIGHSIGEYVAATLAGVFSLENALTLIAARGKLMQQLPAGAMLSVRLSESEIQPWLGTELSIAGINAPSSCVVSGTIAAVEQLQQKLLAQEIPCRRLHTSHAFHSSMVEPIIEPFTEQLRQIELYPPQFPFISNVSGTWITAAEACDRDYWAKHLRQPVRFSAGIAELMKQPERILLEVGAGRTLSTFAKQHQSDDRLVLTSIRHPQEQQSDSAFLLNTLGCLWMAGVNINWSGFRGDRKHYRIPLPTYPFERQRYWIEPPKQQQPQSIWDSLLEAARKQSRNQISQLDKESYLKNKQCLDRLCVAYINQTLVRLGAFENPSEKYSVEELCDRFGILPRYRQLLCRWLDVLVESGQLQRQNDNFSHFIPCSQENLKTIRNEWASSQMLAGIEHFGDRLASVLTGKQEPLELFIELGNKTQEITAELPLNAYLKSIMRTTIEELVRSQPSDKRLRILEIGGGQGIATSELLPILPSQTTYTFTDVGGWFLKQAQQKFSAYPFVEYRSLDIEKPPTEQGFSHHSFDVVVAVNVLHVTKNIETTLKNVRSLLAPGGLLILWEIVAPQLNFDITDALLMNPLEDRQRSRGNPFLSEQQWQEALRSRGFERVDVISETATFGEQVLLAQASNHNLSEQKPDLSDWFYIPSWKRSLPPQRFSSKVGDIWLLFVDECGLGENIAQKLVMAKQDVIIVKIGQQFACHGDRDYQISPQQREDYETLFKELRKQQTIPNKIVHLWNVTPNNDSKNTEISSFYSLLFLTQAIGEQHLTDAIQIDVVSNNMQEVTNSELLCPEKALLLGLVRVIPLEYPNITCRSIDVALTSENRLVDQLLAEFTSYSPDRAIAYRGINRWIQTVEPIRLDKTFAENVPLRQEGVYLITGGLGGVGLALADYLARTVRAKLILIGRSRFCNRQHWQEWLSTHDEGDNTSQKILKLQHLEALGAELTILRADVADYNQMSTAIAQVYRKFGCIHGVIHAAAVPGGGTIQLRTPDAIASAFAPKVTGTRVLESLFKDAELDFFVLCSSLSSFIGTAGMVDYTAENAFIDAFARYSASQEGKNVISINWDRWNGLGMAVAVEARHQEITGETLTAAMSYEEGIEAFSRILGSKGMPQAIVSTQTFCNRTEQNYSNNSEEEKQLTQKDVSKLNRDRPHLSNGYVAPTNEIEQSIAEIWQEILGIERVGIHDNFFELGGDSLFATIFVARLCKTFAVELPYKSFFNAPTVAELAVAIVQKITQQKDEEMLAKALAEIEQLSEDEAQKILTLPKQKE